MPEDPLMMRVEICKIKILFSRTYFPERKVTNRQMSNIQHFNIGKYKRKNKAVKKYYRKSRRM